MAGQEAINTKNFNGDFKSIRGHSWDYDLTTGNSHADILYYEAWLLYKEARYAEALTGFRKALDLNVHYKTYEYIGRCLLELGRPREAIQPLSAAALLNRQVNAPYLCAEALVIIGELSYAEMVLETILLIEPRHRKSIKLMAALKKAVKGNGRAVEGLSPRIKPSS